MLGILSALLWLFSRDHLGFGWIVRSVKTLSALFVRSLSLRHGVPLRFRLLRTISLVLVIALGREILWRYVETTPFMDVPTDASSSGSVPSSPLIDPHEHLAVKEEGLSSSSSFVPLDSTPQVDRRSLICSSWRGMLCQLEDGQGLVLAYG